MPKAKAMQTDKILAAFMLGMFGFFSVGMFISNSYMFGPQSPFGFPMIYWTAAGANQGPVSMWWSRMTATLFLSFLSGPFLFDAPLGPHMKQTMVANVGILLNFIYLVHIDGQKECVQWLWNSQIALQVVLVLVNAYVLIPKDGCCTARTAPTKGLRRSTRKRTPKKA